MAGLAGALQPGNILGVIDLTRLGRSNADLSDIVTVLGRRGIGFRPLAEPWQDTTSAQGKLIFDMFASLAEYERSRLSERTKAGLAAAKARGRLGGRPPAMTAAKLAAAKELRSQGKQASSDWHRPPGTQGESAAITTGPDAMTEGSSGSSTSPGSPP